MPQIFISYRRNSASDVEVYRLHDHLSKHVGGDDHVFLDVQNVAPGSSLPQKISRAVESSEVVIAAIGNEWAPRLNDPDDYVALELKTALASRISVIPVLLSGARMPTREELPADLAALRLVEALPLRQLEFKSDVARLVAIVDRECSARPLRIRWEESMAAHRYADATGLGRQLSDLYGAEFPRNWLEETERERRQRLPETTRQAEQARDFLVAGDFGAARSHIVAALSLLPDDPDLLKTESAIQAAESKANNAHLAETLAAQAEEVLSSADSARGATTSAMNDLARALALDSGVASKLSPLIVDRMRAHLLQKPNHSIRRVYLQARSDRHLKQDIWRSRLVRFTMLFLLSFGPRLALVIFAMLKDSTGPWLLSSLFGAGISFVAPFMRADDRTNHGGCAAGLFLLCVAGLLLGVWSALPTEVGSDFASGQTLALLLAALVHSLVLSGLLMFDAFWGPAAGVHTYGPLPALIYWKKGWDIEFWSKLRDDSLKLP